MEENRRKRPDDELLFYGEFVRSDESVLCVEPSEPVDDGTEPLPEADTYDGWDAYDGGGQYDGYAEWNGAVREPPSEEAPSAMQEEPGPVAFPEEAEPSPEAFGAPRKAEPVPEEAKESRRQKRERKKASKRAIEASFATGGKVRRPIGRMLIAIISLLMVASLGGVTYIVSYFVTRDIRTNAEENNLAINSRTASSCESAISNVISAAGTFLDMRQNATLQQALPPDEFRSMVNAFFSRNEDIAAIYTADAGNLSVNPEFLSRYEIQREVVSAYMVQVEELLEKAGSGSIELQNASPFFAVPLVSVIYGEQSHGEAVCVLFSTESLGDSFSGGSINQSMLVNNSGDILVHGDMRQMMEGASEKDSTMVSAMQQSIIGNGQLTYVDPLDGEEYIGAFKKLPLGNGCVITTVRTSVVLEGINRTTKRNLYITAAILALSIMVVYFFAKTLSVPLKSLTAVVNEINRGDFNTELFNELDVRSRNEIGLLARSTQNEREILNMVTKLTNKGVTKAVITKEIDFNPHLKDITIFFSDIRGFTAISDGFKNRFGEESAAEIISFLNDYMSRMVVCISRTGGIVDKFEGDAIMAAWGTLRNDGLDWESLPFDSPERALRKASHDQYMREDALSAIRCCIAMRYSLMKYNKDAEAFTKAHLNEPKAQYKPHIRIGAGLNSGRATVGFMGSFDKMEFTSIGDAVNFASRTEASNKPCGTDILITEDTLSLLKTEYVRCEENGFVIPSQNIKNEIVVEQIPVEFEVKGKGKQHFYGVVNMPQFDIQEFFGADDADFQVDADCALCVGPGGPRTLSQMRGILGIPEPDFGAVNLDEEENKIQVATA